MTAIAINWSCSSPSWSSGLDESALRTALASLEDCSSSLHWWLGFWTLLVVVGVALEMVFVVWEYIEDLREFRRGLHPPDKPNLLLFVLGFLGAGLVAVGVAGELYAESKIATVETCIRKGNDALFLLLSKEAGDAAAAAKTAHNEADAVKEEADELTTNLGSASKQLSNLEEYAAWRTISDEQAVKLVKRLAHVKGQSILVSLTNAADSETVRFFRKLCTVLDSNQVGMKVTVPLVADIHRPGLSFVVGENREKDFDLIVKALDRAGIEKEDSLRKTADHRPTVGNQEGDAVLQLNVGAKH